MSAFTEANRKAFNDLAETYDSPAWAKKLIQRTQDALIERKDWVGAQWIRPGEEAGKRNVRLLDYACGPGSITRALGPHVTTIRGIDLSENMVKKYNEMAEAAGLTPETAHAVVGDLTGEEVPAHLNTPEFHMFDIIVVAAALHHLEDPARAIQRLAERPKPQTGILVIIDFLKFMDAAMLKHDMAHTIKHDGFDRDTMQKMFNAAGLADFDWDVVEEEFVMELKHGTSKRQVFFARGRSSQTV